MDLKDFVAGSLTQIVEGICEAQSRSAGSGAWINPVGSRVLPSKEIPAIEIPEGRGYLHEVQFDVAVTVSDEGKAGARGGLQILGARLGAEGSLTHQNAAVSRVQFSVPVVWPGRTRPELEKRMQRSQDDHASGDNWKMA